MQKSNPHLRTTGLTNLLIGVELETQALDGKSWNDMQNETHIDMEAAEEEYRESCRGDFRKENGEWREHGDIGGLSNEDIEYIITIIKGLRYGMSCGPIVSKLIIDSPWFETECLEAYESYTYDQNIEIESVEGILSIQDGDEWSETRVKEILGDDFKNLISIHPVILTDGTSRHLVLSRSSFDNMLTEQSNWTLDDVDDLLRELSDGCSSYPYGASYRYGHQMIMNGHQMIMNLPSWDGLEESYIDDAVENGREEISNIAHENARGGEDYSVGTVKNNLASTCSMMVGIERDSTVSGPELQFPEDDGAEVDDVLFALHQFFRYYDVDVDQDCSFHIHVSFDEADDERGWREQGKPEERRFSQYLLLEYITSHISSVPTSVLTDRVGRRHSRFFALKIDNDKYRFIADRCGTWEFRFFGNIDNFPEANECITLAVNACRWAYHPQTRQRFAHIRGRSDLNKLVASLDDRIARGIEEK